MELLDFTSQELEDSCNEYLKQQGTIFQLHISPKVVSYGEPPFFSNYGSFYTIYGIIFVTYIYIFTPIKEINNDINGNF